MIKEFINNIQSQAKNVGTYAMYFFIFLFIASLVRNSMQIVKSYSRVENAKSKLAELERERQELLREKAYVSSDFYREKQARDKLGKAKEEEIVVVLPDEEILRKLSPRVVERANYTLPDPIWKKWIKTFGLI